MALKLFLKFISFFAFLAEDRAALSVLGGTGAWIAANLILANDALKVLISLATLLFIVAKFYAWYKQNKNESNKDRSKRD